MAPLSPNTRRNIETATRLILIVLAIVLVYTAIFGVLMRREGRPQSFLTGIYWTVQTMSTLGFGDVTFHSDLGRMFSVVVLVTGVLLLFVLLPFTLIQFVYAPWLEARTAARTPRRLPPAISGHVILTDYGPIEAALIERLDQFRLPYAVITPDPQLARTWNDHGVRVMVGELDDASTYRNARVDAASLVAATRDDAENAVIALTVRQCSETVPIVATAMWESSVALLKRAGCQQVTQLGELLGRAMARRIAGLGGRTLVIGRLDDLLIAEASLAGTPLVGSTLREARLRERLGVNVVGIWMRGRYTPGTPDTPLTADMSVIFSGTPGQLSAYNRDVRPAERPAPFAVIVGGGRVGRAIAKHLSRADVDYRVIEKTVERNQDPSKFLIGDATDPEVFQAAGLARATSVAVTTHNDDANVFLTLFCRNARPDVQILSRATQERNAATMYQAGANVVLSYVPMEANAIFDALRRGNLLLAEGLETFTVRVPAELIGKTIGDCGLRENTGCNVLAVRRAGGHAASPDIATPLQSDTELVLIGDRDDARKFFARYGPQSAN